MPICVKTGEGKCSSDLVVDIDIAMGYSFLAVSAYSTAAVHSSSGWCQDFRQTNEITIVKTEYTLRSAITSSYFLVILEGERAGHSQPHELHLVVPVCNSVLGDNKKELYFVTLRSNPDR